MVKTRDLFKQIRDTKGTFHAKMGSVKDRNVEKEIATHSSILAWKIHGQRSLACCSPWDYMTEHVCMRVEGDGLVAIKW